MGTIDDMVQALFGGAKQAQPLSFDQRWSPVEDIPKFYHQLSPGLQDLSDKTFDSGFSQYPKTLDYQTQGRKMDDTKTLDQHMRDNLKDFNAGEALKREPGIDPNVLMQLLNPGQTMGQKSGADLPIIGAPDTEMINSPYTQMYNYLNPPEGPKI